MSFGPRVPSCSFQPIDIFSSKDRVLWVKKVTHRRAVNFNLCSAHTLHTGSQPSPGAGMSYVVMAEMVASVFEVVAGAGDIVEPTDTLVILESMKMEIPVLAEVSGVVREMTVVKGDVVNEGDSIAVIDES